LSVSVKYRVITSFSQYTGEFVYSRWVEESGDLLDLKLINDDQNAGYYQISGTWKNRDAGDGNFTLKLFEETKKNTILIQISGSSWSYFDNITLDELKFNEIKSVLRNPNVKINTTNKPAETEQIAEVNNPNAISELCNYGEYISQSNNIDEYLEFTKDENEQLVVQYRTSNKSNTKLGYSGNTIFFMNSSNKKYQIVNIKDDNTGFDLINPDGTIQSFQAIEH
jgi:hypothetical protein